MTAPTTETNLETLVEGTWQRAYVAWRAAHGDDMWAVSCAVPDVATLQLIHGLIEDALRAGWSAYPRGQHDEAGEGEHP
jgi:hypothetical protein